MLPEAPRRWSVGRVVAYSVLVGALFLGTQLLVAIATLVAQSAADSGFNLAEWSERAGSDGLLLSLATFGTTVVCVPFVHFLVARREREPWQVLGFRRVGARSTAIWMIAMAAFLVGSDALTLALRRPLVPDFMLEAYASAGHPAALFAALFVAAPLFEEVFFRGFLLSTLTACGISGIASAVLSSFAWSAIHLQYDLYGLATIFAMGLILAAARFRTSSIVPCLAMHGLANALAFTETALLAGSSAA